MNIFKKIISVSFLLIFVFSIIPNQIFAQGVDPRANIIVGDLVLDKEVYNSGETIRGSFNMINTSAVNAPSVYYTVSLVGDFDEDFMATTFYDKQQANDNFFVAKNNQVNVNFSYVIPETIQGEGLSIEIQAWDGSGVPHGWANAVLNVQGQGGFISNMGAYIAYDGINYNLQHGVTLYEEGVLTVNFENLESEIIIFSNLKIYNRSTVSGDLISEQNLPDLRITEGQQNTLTYTISPDQDSGVYEGLIEFKNSNGQKISNDVAFRYIIPGETATIQSAYSDKQSLNRGDNFNVKVQVIGTPYSMNFEINDIPEGETTLLDDNLLSNNPEALANLEVKIKNLKGKVIAESSQMIKYNQNPLVSFDFEANLAANNFTAEINLIDAQGTIMASENFTLAEGEEVDDFSNKMVWFVLNILIILIIIVSVLIIKNRKQNTSPLLMIAFGILFLGIGALGIYTINEDNISTVKAQDQSLVPYWETTDFVVNENRNLWNWLRYTLNNSEAQTNSWYNSWTQHNLRPEINGVHLQDVATGQTITGSLKPGQTFRVRYSGQIVMCLNLVGETWRSVTNDPQNLSITNLSSVGTWNEQSTRSITYNYTTGATSGGNMYRAPMQPGNYTLSVRVENYPRGANNSWNWQLGRAKFVNGGTYFRGWEEGLIHYTVVDPDAPQCGPDNAGTFSSDQQPSDLCTSGTASGIDTTDTSYRWTCSSNVGTQQCSATRQCPAGEQACDGACIPDAQQCGAGEGDNGDGGDGGSGDGGDGSGGDGSGGDGDGTGDTGEIDITLFGPENAIINSGNSCTLNWTVTGANSCTITGPNTNAEYPMQTGGSSGTHQTDTLTRTSEYTITCSNDGEAIATATASCVINPDFSEF